MKRCVLTFVLAMMVTVAQAQDAPHERLNGRWTSDLMTVTIDFDEGSYEGVAMGQLFDKSLSLVSESPEYIVFMVGENKMVAQFQSSGGVMITKQPDGIPVTLEKAGTE